MEYRTSEKIFVTLTAIGMGFLVFGFATITAVIMFGAAIIIGIMDLSINRPRKVVVEPAPNICGVPILRGKPNYGCIGSFEKEIYGHQFYCSGAPGWFNAFAHDKISQKPATIDDHKMQAIINNCVTKKQLENEISRFVVNNDES